MYINVADGRVLYVHKCGRMGGCYIYINVADGRVLLGVNDYKMSSSLHDGSHPWEDFICK